MAGPPERVRGSAYSSSGGPGRVSCPRSGNLAMSRTRFRLCLSPSAPGTITSLTLFPWHLHCSTAAQVRTDSATSEEAGMFGQATAESNREEVLLWHPWCRWLASHVPVGPTCSVHGVSAGRAPHAVLPDPGINLQSIFGPRARMPTECLLLDQSHDGIPQL